MIIVTQFIVGIICLLAGAAIGVFFGKYHERANWDKLIKNNVLPRPYWTDGLDPLPKETIPFGPTVWVRDGYNLQLKHSREKLNG